MARPIWIVEYQEDNDEWYPVLPRLFYDYCFEADQQAIARKHEHIDGKYRAARYEREDSQ